MTVKPTDTRLEFPLSFGIPTLDDLIDPRRRTRAGTVKTNGETSSSDTTQPDGATQTDGASETKNPNWQMALVGPDGVGKSILALHLASHYLATQPTPDRPNPTLPKVLYFSTDLSALQAQSTWRNFWLSHPHCRAAMLDYAYPDLRIPLEFPRPSLAEPVELKNIYAEGGLPEGMTEQNSAHLRDAKLFECGTQAEVLFFDLQRTTMGDDWTFINRLVGQLPDTADDCGGGEPPRHLVIIDAVEGLETVVGDKDAFGEPRSRRSRIAQLIRTCVRKRTHIVLTVEEPREDDRRPEQFVADVVIRLRQELDAGYNIRTVEIEKCRSLPHVRGKHEISVRNGTGTRTGDQMNLDDPAVPAPDRVADDANEYFAEHGRLKLVDPALGEPIDVTREMAHIHVVPSLHRWNRSVRGEKGRLNQAFDPPTFGLPAIDALFADRPPRWSRQQSPPLGGPAARPDRSPFGTQSLSLLLGDAGTSKSQLSLRFLAEAFRVRREDRHGFDRQDRREWQYDADNGVAVLVTSNWNEHGAVIDRILRHHQYAKLKEGERTIARQQLADRVMCRRISVRYLTGAHFLQFVESYVHHAQARLFRGLFTGDGRTQTLGWLRTRRDMAIGGSQRAAYLDEVVAAVEAVIERVNQGQTLDRISDGLRSLLFNRARFHNEAIWLRRELSPPIRLVIDDWTLIRETHPAIRDDPLVLQSLLAVIQREGVSALIVSTQSGQPNVGDQQLAEQDLRKLDFAKLFTWNVSFYGRKRVAATVSAMNESVSPEVVELRRKSPDRSAGTPEAAADAQEGTIVVNRDFSLYAGLESGNLRRIPLRVQLYAGDHRDQQARSQRGFHQIVQETMTRIFAAEPTSEVIQFEYKESYDDFFASTDWVDHSRLDHTLVLQIDEFWSDTRGALLDLTRYYCAEPLYRLPEPSEPSEPLSRWVKVKSLGEAFGDDSDQTRDQTETYVPLVDYDEPAAAPADGPAPPTIAQHYQLHGGGSSGLNPPERDNLVRRDFFYDERQNDYELHSSEERGERERREELRQRPESAMRESGPPTPVQGDPADDAELQRPETASEAGEVGGAGEVAADPFRSIESREPVGGSRPPKPPATIPHSRVDRVPYLWDFGFLLARRDFWKDCGEASLPSRPTVREYSKPETGKYSRPTPTTRDQISIAPRTVRDVWNTLCLPGHEIEGQPTSNDPMAVEWEDLFDACRIVADRTGCDAFSTDLTTGESISCLLLEVWLSQIAMTLKDPVRRSNSPLRWLVTRTDDAQRVVPSRWGHLPFDQFLRTFLPELFLATTRLVSAAPHLGVRGDHIQSASKDPTHVAARREWYSTSVSLMRSIDGEHHFRPLRLPGAFSTRGDWSLAIARGSRSQLLGCRAIDLLNSRQLSTVRLRAGLGLPVRDIVTDAEARHEETALSYFEDGQSRERLLSYGDLCRLGAVRQHSRSQAETPEPAETDGGTDGGANGGAAGAERPLEFLFRSKFENYDRFAFAFRKMAVQLLRSPDQWLLHELLEKTMYEEFFVRLGEVPLNKSKAGQLDPDRDLRFLNGLRQRADAQTDADRSVMRKSIHTCFERFRELTLVVAATR